MSIEKKVWALTKPAFDKLLAQFDSDPERAGVKYEQVRAGIIKYFECRGSIIPHELADETINRVARKVDEGADIHESSFSAYFYGVARNIFKESLRRPDMNVTQVDGLPRHHHPMEDPIKLKKIKQQESKLEQQLRCLESCIDKLPRAARQIILSYYEWEKGAKIEYRKQLAEAFGLSPNSLRIRVHRIREKLEKCVETCLAHFTEYEI